MKKRRNNITKGPHFSCMKCKKSVMDIENPYNICERKLCLEYYDFRSSTRSCRSFRKSYQNTACFICYLLKKINQVYCFYFGLLLSPFFLHFFLSFINQSVNKNKKRPGRLLNVLCTFNLRPVSMGSLI